MGHDFHADPELGDARKLRVTIRAMVRRGNPGSPDSAPTPQVDAQVDRDVGFSALRAEAEAPCDPKASGRIGPDHRGLLSIRALVPIPVRRDTGRAVSRENLETAYSCVRALNRRDVDAYLACCTDNVELIPATGPIEGEYQGRSGIKRFLADLADTAPDIQVDIERPETIGQNVLACERAHASGRTTEVGGEVEFTSVYELAGRKIRRIQVFLNRQEALEAVGLSE